MSSDILKNYPILTNYKNNTFFDSEFLKRIQNVINNAEKNIVQTKNIIDNGKIIQEKRIVNDYIVPLSYLIYSFIYTKYYNYQLKTQMILENKLYYSMFGYVFKHNNPVIKKVNVNLYNYFKNEDLSGTSEITLDMIITQKEAIIIFLDSTVIPKMKDDNDYKLFEKYNIILDYFNKITLDVINIIKNLKLIIGKIDPTTSNTALTYFNTLELGDLNSLNTNLLSINKIHDLYKKINDFYETKIVLPDNKSARVNFINIFNDISIEKQSNKFNEYEEYYYKLLDIYKNMIKKIEFINTQIIELDNKDNLIYYDNINLFIIASSYQKYYNEYIDKEKIKIDIDNKIVNIKNIKLNIEQKIDTYKELFYNDKNNSNTNKKIKTDLYLEKIDEIYEKINKNLESLLKKKNNTFNSANNNVNFNDFLKYFILSFQVNEQIEKNYIKVIYKNSKNSNINIKEYLSKLQSYKITFNNLFKDYKKLDKNSETKNLEKKEKENILKLESIKIQIKSYEKNINSSTIDSNISQLESKIITTNDQLKNARKDLEEIANKKEKIESIKNDIKINNFLNEKNKTIINTTNIQDKLNKINNDINNFKLKINKALEQKKEKEDKLDELNSSLVTRKNKTIEKLTEDRKEEKQKLTNIKDEFEKTSKDIYDKTKNKSNLGKKILGNKSELDNNQKELEKEKKKLENKEKELENKQNELENKEKELESKKKELENKQIELKKKKNIRNIEDEKKIIKNIQDLEENTETIKKLKENIRNIEENIEKLKENIRNIEENIKNLSNKIIENNSKVETLTKNISNLEIKKRTFEKSYYNNKKILDSRILSLNKEIKALEEGNRNVIKKIEIKIKNNKSIVESDIIKIEKFITTMNEKINELNKEKESLEKEKKKKNDIKKIINNSINDKIFTNDKLNIINTIYNNINKKKKLSEKKLIGDKSYDKYKEIEEIYLKDSSSTSDFTSKNIYRRIFIILNYYNRDYDNKTKDIKRLENELTNLKNNKNSKKIKKYIFDMYNEIKDNLESISLLIKEEKLKISTNSKNNSNKDLKDKFNNEFNSIIIISKQYEFVIDSKNYKKMNNKLLNYYNKNYIFIKIIDKITNNKIRNNETTEESKKENTKENENIKITNELSNYFYTNDIFIDKLNIFSKDFKDENVSLFFKQYQEFYNILKNKKIKLLINKINNGIIKYNDLNNNNFINGIQTKIDYYNKIKESGEPSKNEFKEKKGKYTQVLPYTDIMFLYFIDLLIIIDYLTFYYE